MNGMETMMNVNGNNIPVLVDNEGALWEFDENLRAWVSEERGNASATVNLPMDLAPYLLTFNDKGAS